MIENEYQKGVQNSCPKTTNFLFGMEFYILIPFHRIFHKTSAMKIKTNNEQTNKKWIRCSLNLLFFTWVFLSHHFHVWPVTVQLVSVFFFFLRWSFSFTTHIHCTVHVTISVHQYSFTMFQQCTSKIPQFIFISLFI